MKRLSLKGMVKKGKRKGFTLIELIIVIAIIAILAAMAIPKFSAIRKSANIKTDIATAKNIQTIVASLVADGSKKPGDTIADADIAPKLDGGVVPKPKAVPDKTFTATVDSDGNVIVNVGDDEVYPTPSGTTYGTGSKDSAKGEATPKPDGEQPS